MTPGEPHVHAVARFDPPPPDDAVFAHLPADGRDQSCAVCEATEVAWVYPFARSRTGYRLFGKSHSLPSFWCVCSDCETSYEQGDDAALARRLYDSWCSDDARPPMISETEWFHGHAEQPVAVWRRADLGARPLPPG